MSEKDYIADRDALQRNDWTVCRTPDGARYLSPETDPKKVLDTDEQSHTVGANTCGRTHFRPQEADNRRLFERLSKHDDGHYVPGSVEKRASANRIDDRKQFAVRTADAVIDAPQRLKSEILRLIEETDLRAFNIFNLKGETGGIDAAIVGFTWLVLPPGSDGGLNPIVIETAEALNVSNIGEVIKFTDRHFCYPE